MRNKVQRDTYAVPAVFVEAERRSSLNVVSGLNLCVSDLGASDLT